MTQYDNDTQPITWFIMSLILLLEVFITYVMSLFIQHVKFSSISETLAKTSTETTIWATYGIVGASFMISFLGAASCYTISDEDYPMYWKVLLILSPPVCSLIIVMPLSKDFYRIRLLKTSMFETPPKWESTAHGSYFVILKKRVEKTPDQKHLQENKHEENKHEENPPVKENENMDVQENMHTPPNSEMDYEEYELGLDLTDLIKKKHTHESAR